MFYVNDPSWKEACLVSPSSLSVLINCLFLNLNFPSAFSEDCRLHWLNCVICLLWVEKFNFLSNKVHNHITSVGCSREDNTVRPHGGDMDMSCVQQADRITVSSYWFHTWSIWIIPDLSPRDDFPEQKMSLLWRSPDTKNYQDGQHLQHLKYIFFFLFFKINLWGYMVDVHIDFRINHLKTWRIHQSNISLNF